MKYMGSKSRHAKQIIPFLMEHYEEGMLYIEPFVGGPMSLTRCLSPTLTSMDVTYMNI